MPKEYEGETVSSKSFRELKKLSNEELLIKVQECESQLFHVRMKWKTGQLVDTAIVWRLRKNLARIKTLQTQLRLQLSDPGVSR